ncbi:scube2, partial [Symbiodinium microadriaticum]
MATPTAAFQILAEEYLGYNVRLEVANSLLPQDSLYAVAGCENPTNAQNRGCHGQETRMHVAVGVYLDEEVTPHFDRVQRFKMGGVLDDLSSLGFFSQSGLYVNGASLERAAAERIFLDDYRNYDVNYRNPKEWFSSLETIDKSLLVACAIWSGVFPDIGRYLYFTGDADGVNLSGTEPVPKCPDGYWWLSPACRHNSSDCIPTLAGAAQRYVYGVEELMSKAIAFSMPMALGATDAGRTFGNLVSQHNALFYFWEPDLTLGALGHQLISFPEFNEQRWALGDKETMAQPLDHRKIANQNLDLLAPDARGLLMNMELDLPEVLDMMRKSTIALQQILNALPVSSADDLKPEEWWGACWQGACEWLQQNRETWQGWMPEQSNCYAGQGMQEDGVWLTTRSPNATCGSCPPGRYSVLLEDALGATAVCRLCHPGTSQEQTMSVSCDVCLPGTKADQWGATQCQWCPQGQYQWEFGATECRSCEESKTTIALASISEWDCVCKPGRYLWNETECMPCPEGMYCAGDSFPVFQLAGYWVEQSYVEGLSSYSVFSCRETSRCPAGEPGLCNVGRTGRACADCFRGYASDVDGSCKPCDALSMWPFLLLPIVMLGLLPLLVAATILMSRARRVAISIFIVCVIFGQLVVCLQSLE